MITRKCDVCKEEMPLDKNNSAGIVLYKKKYCHRDCFIEMVQQKMAAKNAKKAMWQEVLDSTEQLTAEATEVIREAVAKDGLYCFIVERYKLSYVSNTFFTKLGDIHNGKYHGLTYPIGPEELLAEWEYYWDFLLSSTQFKNIDGEPLVSYHLAVLLSRNAEYRTEMERKKVEEQVVAAQRESDIHVDNASLQMMQKNTERIQDGKRRANLFKEVMGDGN